MLVMNRFDVLPNELHTTIRRIAIAEAEGICRVEGKQMFEKLNSTWEHLSQLFAMQCVSPRYHDYNHVSCPTYYLDGLNGHHDASSSVAVQFAAENRDSLGLEDER